MSRLVHPLRRTTRRTRAVLAVLVGVTALASGTGTTMASEPAPGSERDFEVEFMTMTVDHHRSALEMGELCVAKATRADLRELCQTIVDAQAQEIAQLQEHLQDWYGVRKEPMIQPEQVPVLERLHALSGSRFDAQVSREFIVHHAMLLPDAERCRRDPAHHRPLRQMCHEMFDTQSEEIGQFIAIERSAA